ncbi:hypothetical protein EON65_38110 [archaeon]|nr:MAG: hypothetical protein EON65_38110 [archaeon]
MDYAISSESVGIDILYPAYTFERDLRPGEAIFIPTNNRASHATSHATHTSQPYTHICHTHTRLVPCLFEYVYFARPDSILDGVQVYEARYRMGERLAKKVLEVCGEGHGIDVVIPIPETSRTVRHGSDGVYNWNYLCVYGICCILYYVWCMVNQSTRNLLLIPVPL